MATYRPYPKSPLHDILVENGHIKEPETLMEWKNEYNVKLYGMYDNKKPWQENYTLSTNMSFYTSAESSVWVREHQLDRYLDKLFLRWIKAVAKFRNRYLFYHWTIDRDMFRFFRDQYYERREITSQKKTTKS